MNRWTLIAVGLLAALLFLGIGLLALDRVPLPSARPPDGGSRP